MRKTLQVAICFLIGSLVVAAQEPCLKYEPDVVELVGKIKRQTFPGPPNYESVKQGDRPETYWVLFLPKAFCVKPGANSPNINSSPESDISQLQLIEVDYKRYRKLLGKKVRAKGRLSHAITGHHHTTVLLEVISLEPAT